MSRAIVLCPEAPYEEVTSETGGGFRFAAEFFAKMVAENSRERGGVSRGKGV